MSVSKNTKPASYVNPDILGEKGLERIGGNRCQGTANTTQSQETVCPRSSMSHQEIDERGRQ